MTSETDVKSGVGRAGSILASVEPWNAVNAVRMTCGMYNPGLAIYVATRMEHLPDLNLV